MSRKISFRLSAAVPLFCVCGFAAFLAGCSETWIAGEPPDTPRNAFRPDPVKTPAPEPKDDDYFGASSGEAQLASLPPAPVPSAAGEPAPSSPAAVPEPVPAGKPAPKELGPVDDHAGSNSDIKYTVQVNDTLSGIAYIYGISVEDLASHNGLTVKSTIKPKQVIYIPSEKISDKNARPVQDVKDAEGLAPLDKAAKPKAASGTGKEAGTAAPAGGTEYTVAAGDSLSGIGAKFHVRYADIAKANGLKIDAKLRVGQKLIIPEAKPGAVSGNKTVKSKPAKPTKAAKQDKPAKQDKAAKQDKPAKQDNASAADGKDAVASADKSAKTAEAKTDAENVPSDADIFGDEGDASATASAPEAAPAAKKTEPAKPAASAAAADASDPAVVFQFSLPNEMSIRDICRNMGYTEESVLKLNPGIGVDERLSAGRTVTIPMIPDAE